MPRRRQRQRNVPGLKPIAGLREKLTLRDIGIWSHYVGDASQPLHVSVHFNGWGDYPNPAGYTNSKKIHAYFEGELVRRYLKRDAVAAEVKPWRTAAARFRTRRGPARDELGCHSTVRLGEGRRL